MRSKSLTPSIFEYVMGVYKGSGKTLGEIAAQARQFEDEMNAWIETLDQMEEVSM
jgi:hypothetical protein